MKCPLVNIGNIGRRVYLFIRHEDGRLEIKEDNGFFPYYFEEHMEGEFKSFNGKLLKKVFVSKPSDIRKFATKNAWESDINFSIRYLIDKVDNLEKCKIKYSFIDIETLSKTFPNPLNAPDPVSCISSSNSFTDEIITFYLGDYNSEHTMIEAFIKYLQKEHYDILLGWNFCGFDFPYLCARYSNFAQRISPISIIKNNSFYKGRYVNIDMLYPIGTSVVDYMLLDKKYTSNRKREYSLNARLFETIGREKEIKKIDFGKLSLELKQRNINDVRDLMLMEKKLQYIPMLDGIRRASKTQWEDYLYYSRPINNLLLSEAKKRNIVLPNKPKKEGNPIEFEGAFRESFSQGRFFNHGGYDLSGAYLNVIIEFFLDPSNIYNEKVENSIPINVTDRVTCGTKITYHVKQNQDLLLPAVAKKLLNEKNKFKELKNNTDPNSLEYKDIEEKYAAWKNLALSTWGTIGEKYFRYYDHRCASLITSIIRDLLHYVINELKILGYEVIYLDTDGLILDDKGENQVKLLNSLIQKWSQDRYKRNTKIVFDYEGNYEKIFIIALTRYKGYLRRPDGTLEEKIVGIEAKRKNSTVFIKKFQTELLEKLMNKESKENVIAWIKEQIKTFSNQPLINIAFPCRMARKKEDYKNIPIFARALDYTKEISNFNKRIGEPFYYIYMKSFGQDTKMAIRTIKGEKKEVEVIKDKTILAFDEENYNHIDRNEIDWVKMIKRNVTMKLEPIFEAMKWDVCDSIWLSCR